MHFTITFTIVASLASFIGTYATPIQARYSSCTPNFAGVGQSIVNNYTETEWFPTNGDHPRTRIDNFSPPVLNVGDFSVQQDGQDPANFLIKDIFDPNLIVTARRHKMFLHHARSDNTQLFNIACTTCILGDSVPPTAVDADGCIIQSVFNGWCATADDVSGSPVLLQPCDGSTEQIWTFFAGA